MQRREKARARSRPTARSQDRRVAERRRDPLGLRRLEKADRGLFAALCAELSEAVLVLARSGTILFMNPAAERLLGHPAAETIGRNVALVMPPAAARRRGSAALSRWTNLQGVEARGREVLVRTAAGESIPVHLRLAAVAIDGKRYLMAMIRDTAERQRAAAALQLSEAERQRHEESLANAQRIAQIGSWRWDAATDGVTWSRETYRILGIDPATPPAYELMLARVHPEDHAQVSAVIEDSLERAVPRSLEYRILRDDGTLRVVHEHAEVVCGADGSVICMNGTIQDVTERKREEEALRRAKEAAELASRAKSDFLANMSHELRTPLNAIIGFSEVMAEEMLGPLGEPTYATYVRDILESGRHLLALINDILDMARIEAGAVQLTEGEVDLATVAEAALRLIRPRAAEGGLRLVVDLAPELPALKADARLMRQLVISLLSNAVKFTPAGGTVSLRAAACPAGGVWFSVADTGIGIAAADIPRAFEPFVQLDSALNRKYEGSGLGLPLVRSIVELHGGTLDVDSTPHVGTTVTVRLPPARSLSRGKARGRAAPRRQAGQ